MSGPRVAVLAAACLLVLTGCGNGGGGAPDFQPAPGKVRVTPAPASGGRNVTRPANVTVDGTPVLVVLRDVTGGRASLAVTPRPTDPEPGRSALATLGSGQSTRVAGLTVTVDGIWGDTVDVEVTR